jgi:hypothetical protein
MMRTIIYRIEARAARFQIISQTRVYDFDQVFGEITARDARLIRNDNGEPARLV